MKILTTFPFLFLSIFCFAQLEDEPHIVTQNMRNNLTVANTKKGYSGYQLKYDACRNKTKITEVDESYQSKTVGYFTTNTEFKSFTSDLLINNPYSRILNVDSTKKDSVSFDLEITYKLYEEVDHKSIHFGKPLRVRIENLNLLKYKVDIIAYQDTSETGWKGILDAAKVWFGKIGFDPGNFASDGDKENITPCDPEKMIEKIKKLEKDLENANKAGATDAVKDIIKKNIDLQTKEYRSCYEKTMKQYINAQSEVYKKLLEKINGFGKELELYYLMNKNAPDCGDFAQLNKDREQILSNINIALGCSDIDVVSCLNEKVQQEINNQRVLVLANLKEINENKYLKDQFNLNEYTAALDKADTSLFYFTKTVILLFDRYPSYFQYNIPQVKKADNLILKLNIEPTDADKTIGGIRVADQEIEIPVHGGLRFHFGAGLLITGFRNASYSIIETPAISGSGTVKRLYRNSINGAPSDVNVGVSAIGFATTPIAKYLSAGGAFGAGFTSDLNFSFLLGPSFLIGKWPKIGLSGGIALSSKRIPYRSINMPDFEGAQSDPLPSSISTTENALHYSFRPNWFFSVTVAFGNRPGRIQTGGKAVSKGTNTAKQ
jgi:hypothetical protein